MSLFVPSVSRALSQSGNNAAVAGKKLNSSLAAAMAVEPSALFGLPLPLGGVFPFWLSAASGSARCNSGISSSLSLLSSCAAAIALGAQEDLEGGGTRA